MSQHSHALESTEILLTIISFHTLLACVLWGKVPHVVKDNRIRDRTDIKRPA